ncbi:MAG: 50S ribosomal protein L21 [Calditrichaeota bacterium]|nr:MAG: 50S ribosomal protein L21 [Calditrichota bacterium]
MFAVVNIAGKQFKVSKNESILAPKVKGEVGKSIEFDQVLLLSDKGKVTVGKPTVAGAKVKAKIVDFERGKKVIVYKKKRRKGYEVKRGHRQDYTRLLIQSITTKQATKTKEKKSDGA